MVKTKLILDRNKFWHGQHYYSTLTDCGREERRERGDSESYTIKSYKGIGVCMCLYSLTGQPFHERGRVGY